MQTIIIWLLALATILCGCLGGVYFVFSSTIMRSLVDAGAATGPAVMVSINRVILGSAFMPLFVASVILSLAIGLAALLMWHEPWAVPAITATAVWLIGMFVVTAVVHVPMNDRLAASAGDQQALATLWKTYAPRWTRWNHLRTSASLIAAALYFIAALRAT